ncbi:hypothetical protein C0W88_09150 [Photobacterium leiognathi subsp. mandapamensis]|uniref:lipopolysaccharide biosynthesis protein n=1 Tax=Photobacterium leiognathi TaxID=553611 RepID=UPI000D1650B9|nr:oligosaccharide flippase family protein [Photobacterium leiognathi]PSW65236.1 hypothetical protein C0W88_09150 [Photobacterium leiognathi subsp. mandapamensis]
MANFLSKDKLIFILSFVGAQLITFLALPLITRLYTPELFGAYSYNLAIISILGYLSCFRLNLMLQIEINEIQLEKRVGQCYFLTIVISIILLILGFVIFGLSSIMLIYAISILLLGMYEIHIDYYSSKLEYKKIAKMNMIRTISVVLSQLVLYSFEDGLIYGFFIGLVISQLFVFSSEKFKFKKIYFPDRYKIKFMCKNTFITIVNFIGSSAPLIVINYFTTTQMLGVYSLADKLLISLFVMVNNIFSRFIFNDLKEKDIITVFKKWFCILTIFFSIILLIVFLIPNSVFSLVFGKGWDEALGLMRCLMPWFGLQLFMILINCLYVKEKKEEQLIVIEVVKNITRILSIVILVCFPVSIEDVVFISSVIPVIFVWIVFYLGIKNENLFLQK